MWRWTLLVHSYPSTPIIHTYRELQEQLVKVSRLIEAHRGDNADKDARIEELSFENRALRQNAQDEKEVSSSEKKAQSHR